MKIYERFWNLLQDGKMHDYKEIAQNVWGCKLDRALQNNIRITRFRTEKRYNVEIKCFSNRGLRYVGGKND